MLASHYHSNAAFGALPRGAAHAHATAFVAALLAVLVYGSLRIGAAPKPQPPHASAMPAAPRALHASCLLRVLNAAPELPEEALWARTAARIDAGDDLVLWSETAVAVTGAADERALLARAARLAAAGAAYVGIAYEVDPSIERGAEQAPGAAPRRAGGAPAARNAVARLRPGIGPVNASAHGAVAFRYLKGHPVLLIEAGYRAGPRRLRFEDAPWGRTTAGICFDHDFPSLMRQAGAGRAAVALQPSETWGPKSFRERHATGNALRALENGYTLIRCGCVRANSSLITSACSCPENNASMHFCCRSNGVTAAVGPRLERFAWQETGTEGLVTMALPAPHALRANTFYTLQGGWLFGWACVAASAVAAAVVLAPERALPPAWRAALGGHAAVPSTEDDAEALADAAGVEPPHDGRGARGS